MTRKRPYLTVSLIFALVVLAGCASQSVPLDLQGARSFARDDVQRGLEIAQAANDPAGATCALAILSAVDSLVAPLAPNGAFSAFIVARETRRKLDAGLVPDAIHQACAAVILDAETTLVKLGLIAVPGGGIAGKMLGR